MLQRPNISQIVIDNFSKIIDLQDAKGNDKYGKTIDEASDKDYDWKLMALEESADLQKYLVKEIVKLKSELHKLKAKNWFKVYSENLQLAMENDRLKQLLAENKINF